MAGAALAPCAEDAEDAIEVLPDGRLAAGVLLPEAGSVGVTRSCELWAEDSDRSSCIQIRDNSQAEVITQHRDHIYIPLY
jgi:hypothetical protein